MTIKTDNTLNWMLIVTIKGTKDIQQSIEMKWINRHNEIVLQSYSRVSTLLLGKRGTALPTTLRFSNQSENISIIISGLGRVCLCSNQRLGYSQALNRQISFSLKQQGFSLIEVLISLIISNIVFLAIITLYLILTQQINLLYQAYHFDIVARKFLLMLEKDVRRSGYFLGIVSEWH